MSLSKVSKCAIPEKSHVSHDQQEPITSVMLQHTIGHVDCPGCGATTPMSTDPDDLANLLFPAAAKRWLATRKPFLKERTHYGYGLCIERLSVFFYALPLNKVCLGHLRTYQAQRAANDTTLDAFADISEIRKLHPEPVPGWPKEAGVSCINHELSVMQSVLKRGGLWKPFRDKYEALRKPRTRKRKTLEDEQVLHLIEVCSGRPSWELAFWVANITGNTGASGTELRHIRLEDLHLGEKIPWMRIDDEHAKNEFRGRRVALNTTALWYVRKCLIRAKTLGCSELEHYLFPLRVSPGVWEPKKPAGASWMRRAFASMRKKSGFDWLTPHCFRHQCATLLYENDVDEMTIVHTLGHQAASMSRDYSHNRLVKQKAALDAIDTAKRLGVQSVDLDSLHEEYENKYSMTY